MNEITKKFFLKIYLSQATLEDYVDWAVDCLEEGLDTKHLRLLAGMSKRMLSRADVEEYFRFCLDELGWRYLNEKEVLLSHAQNLAKEILSGKLEPVKGCSLIHEISGQLSYPSELNYWGCLDEGVSSEWQDETWIPGLNKYNHEKWLEAVMREAGYLAERKFV